MVFRIIIIVIVVL